MGRSEEQGFFLCGEEKGIDAREQRESGCRRGCGTRWSRTFRLSGVTGRVKWRGKGRHWGSFVLL